MDFLYSDLNEIVDPWYYTYEDTDGTIKIDIDNLNRIIKANVIKLPHIFSANTLVNGREVLTVFDGSSDESIDVPDYSIEAEEINDNTSPTGKSIRYWLVKYNYAEHRYIRIGEPISGGGGGSTDLNIENGWTSDDYVDSQKLGKVTAGITSVKYQYGSKENPKESKYIPNDLFNTETEQRIISLKNEQEIHGGTITGVQSIAFGGESFGISKFAVVSFNNNGKVTNYNILQESEELTPKLILLNATNNIDKIESVDNQITIQNVLFNIHFIDNEIISLTLDDTSQSSIYSSTVIRGNDSTPTADGNQSISVGGSTKAHADWSQAFGLGTETARSGQMAVGIYNDINSNALFVVGNGRLNSDSLRPERRNAFAIYDDDSVDIKIDNGILE